MAINVNTVYTTVLSILNKEQRGYLTPFEFNKLATQVQLETFEKFFDDYNQYLRMPKTDVDFASRMENIRNQFQIFNKNETASAVSGNVYTQPLNDGVLTGTISNAGTGYSSSTVPQSTTGGSGTGFTVNITASGTVSSFTIASKGSGYSVGDVLTISGGGGNAQITVNSLSGSFYRFGSAFYETGTNSPEIQIVSKRELHQQNLSPLTQPTTNFPIATYQDNKLTVLPAVASPAVSDIGFNYIRKPADVIWAYGVDTGAGSGNTGAFIWDGTPGFSLTPVIGGASVNFEISDIQQTEVILKILQYSGVIIRDPNIVQAAARELQQEEVNSKR